MSWKAPSHITVIGDAHLILADGASFAVTGDYDEAGITVSDGNSLSIYAQSAGGNMGALAGIGYGAGDEGGSITINGETVTATGGINGAELQAIQARVAKAPATAPMATLEPSVLPNLAPLYEENSDLTGWLTIDGTVIDYRDVQVGQ